MFLNTSSVSFLIPYCEEQKLLKIMFLKWDLEYFSVKKKSVKSDLILLAID